MNLGQLLRSIARLDGDLTIYVATGELSEHSDVALVDLEDSDEPDGMRELIDVLT
jgi:hypothetical protein